MDTDTTRLEGQAPPATAEILDGLNDLLQLDHDAVGAYEIAMRKLEDRDHADQVAGFRRDHERHIRALNELISELGGMPKNEPHATGPFKQALQSLGAVGGDRGLLLAFRANELQVREKYDRYAAKANAWPTHVKRVIDGCALDEERHYRWVADVLAAKGVGSGEGAEVDAIDAARERARVAGQKVDAARARASEVAGQAKARAGELADEVRERVAPVANRISGMFSGGEADGSGGGPGMQDRIRMARGRAGEMAVQAREAEETFEQRFRERPLQTLALAGLAGFVIGRLLR